MLHASYYTLPAVSYIIHATCYIVHFWGQNFLLYILKFPLYNVREKDVNLDPSNNSPCSLHKMVICFYYPSFIFIKTYSTFIWHCIPNTIALYATCYMLQTNANTVCYKLYITSYKLYTSCYILQVSCYLQHSTWYVL